MRRRVLIAALLLALTLVGAALARDPRAEQVRLKPADVALANRIALKTADLGAGWSKQAIPAGEDSGMKCPEVDPDFSKFTITGKARSAFRVVAKIETPAARASIYADVIAFQRGRSIAVLSFTAPFKPYAQEAKVAVAVASRMR